LTTKVSDWSKWYAKNKETYLAVKRVQVLEEYYKNKSSYTHRIRTLLKASKRNAKHKNVPFALTLDHLMKLWHDQNGCCLITKRPFELTDLEGAISNPNAPSLDRIIPKLGYTEDNVRLIIWGLNVGMNEFGFEKFTLLCEDVLKYVKDKQ